MAASLPLRRQDTVGFFFSFYPDYGAVCDFIFDVLKVDYNDIIGFQQLSGNKVAMKFANNRVFQDFCDKYDEKECTLGPGKTVRVINFSRIYTYVSIRQVPFDMDNALLENILGKYGKVYGIRRNRFAYGKAKGLENGTRTARMELKHNIPSSMNIQGHLILLLYNGQNKTCFKCGRDNHMAVDCVYEREDKINIFSTSDFPTMQMGNKKFPEVRETRDNKNTGSISEKHEKENLGTEEIEVDEDSNNVNVDDENIEPCNAIIDDSVDPSQSQEGPTVQVVVAEVHKPAEGTDEDNINKGNMSNEEESTEVDK